MSIIVCPYCNHEIHTHNTTTYYARHRQQILEKYKENSKNPEFIKKRRKIALKSYHKRKQECQNQ